ncbi:restriction endonuclease subunit S [Aliivibrio fischeri]|uniref:restriction endonuclease subunit S n=1 Tax=Aliivibrio fischeri TaxID=668 RepID=UPI0012D99805|nr:restriction endonuclease subunit S [Aliivibrio fischeri]MUK76174.1 restriction endonuclease subunit S [Aliivibrio fischeri]
MNAKHQLTEYGHLSSKLLCSKLSDLCVDKIGVQTGPFGSQLHKEDYVEIGTPIITVEHLGNNRISHIETPFVADEDKKRLSKYQLKNGDIVFSRVGSVDRRALVRKEEDGWLFSGRCLRVRVDETKIDPIYLSYFFGLESFKKYIRSIAVGATMPSINTKILSDIPIYYPESLEEQRRIAHILIINDEKENINNQTNQTLEEMAQAIFKSWFVDFEPVKAKMNGEQPEGMDATTASFFPEKLVESELGLIPEGWDVKPFKKVIDKYVDNRGKTPPIVENGIPLVEVKHLPENSAFPKLNTDKRVTKDTFKTWFRVHVEPKDVLISTVGTIGRTSFVKNTNFCIAQNVLGLRFGKIVEPEYMFYTIKAHRFQHDMDARLVTTVQSSIKRKDLDTIDILVPPSNVQKEFCKLVGSLLDGQYSKNAENIDLASLRDTLLPKLLSGEIELEVR